MNLRSLSLRTSTEGNSTVVESSPEFRVVSRNAIEDEFLASPGISEAQVFLRGKSALYCLEDRK